MAKQDFKNGGFIGSLGGMVGQRFKSIYTVRTRGKYTNPRTPEQQKNRGRFALITRISQVSNLMNWRAPAFISDTKPEWGQRMAAASSKYKESQNIMASIPLCPLDYTPAFTISDVSVLSSPASSVVELSVSGTLPSVDRDLIVCISLDNSESFFDNFELYFADFRAGSQPKIEVKNADAEQFVSGAKLRIVSIDDKNFDNTMLYSGLITLA